MKVSIKALFLILLATLVMIVVYAFQEKPEPSWTNEDGTAITCRYPGCSSSPVYPDLNRRYCSAHINDTHYCRYPNCMTPVPNSTDSKYCSQHEKLGSIIAPD